MRDIRFRRWNGKVMEDCGIIDIDDKRSMDYYNWFDGYSGETMSFEKAPIMQYTGLKDKNGKEIYEGDILNDGNQIMEVKWFDKFSCFCLVADRWMFPHFFGEASDPDNCQVIGNIYENPELLKP